jgi:cyclopropane-fatty-acyl-phospholipid synthase
MADQKEIEAHYDMIGVLHALRVKEVHGGFPDYTCAYFNGDFSKSLAEAQADKHAWIFENLGLGQDLHNTQVLEIGCGWGPILHAIKKRGGNGVGLTLSTNQKDYCVQHGLDARLKDYKELQPGELANQNGIISVGAMEAFCSVEEYKQGKQMEIYQTLFKICADRLPIGGRVFIQTMIWGKSVPDPAKVYAEAPHADPRSDVATLARIGKFYPGSFLPESLAQIITSAKPYFKFITSNNGRLDYIETLDRWGQNTKNLLKPSIFPSTALAALKIIGSAIVNKDTRDQLASLYYNDQQECFRRELMTHERIFFEKVE